MQQEKHKRDNMVRVKQSCKCFKAPVASSGTKVLALGAKVEDLASRVSALGSKASYLHARASDWELMLDSLTEDVVKQGLGFKAITDALTERLDAMQKQQVESTKRRTLHVVSNILRS